MKKVFLTIFLVSFLTTGCKADNILNNQNVTHINIVKQKSKEKIEHNYSEISDMRGCQFLFESGEWKKSKYGPSPHHRYVWDKDRSWFDGRTISSGGISLDFDSKDNSAYISQQKKFHIAYIGPWQKTNLVHYEGSFFNRKKITEERQIRFVAYQAIDYKNPPALNYHGDIRYLFESMTEENKNIPEKSLSLLSDATPDLFNLCLVKWTANFGYNAVAEVKSKSIFSKDYLVPTGKIIAAKE